jgi:hypothetical protein
MKPKVRARLISRRNEVEEKSIEAVCRMALEHGVVEFDLEIDLEAIKGSEARPLVTVADFHRPADADEALRGAFCSAMPADWMRNTKGPALPSMIGTSLADSSTVALSMPSPASADIRCSTVATRTPSLHQGRAEGGLAHVHTVGAAPQPQGRGRCGGRRCPH